MKIYKNLSGSKVYIKLNMFLFTISNIKNDFLLKNKTITMNNKPFM